MFHILFSIIFCGCFYIFHMLNSHDRSCMISQHTFHTISHTFHSFTYLFHSIWWCEKEDIISHGFHMVISHYFSQMCEIVCEKPNENFTCNSHAFHIISFSSGGFFIYVNVLNLYTISESRKSLLAESRVLGFEISQSSSRNPQSR